MRVTLERELKLDVEPTFVLPDLGGTPLDGRLFTSTYYDNRARSLARAGITLRRRLENGLSLWQLKLPRDAAARAEVEAPGGPAGPPDEVSRLLAAHRRHGALLPVAVLRTRRTGVSVDGIADVTIDAVDVLDDGQVRESFAEVEVELTGGVEWDLDRLGKRLRRAGARTSEGEPKVLRVTGVPPVQALAENASLLEQLQHLLREQQHRLERHDPGVRLGDSADDVHRFRVATRRTRALIRATRPLLGGHLAELGAELKWLAGVLGPVRDLDVLLERLGGELASLGEDSAGGAELLSLLTVERSRARAALLEAIGSERYEALLDSFAARVEELPAVEAAEDDAQRLARRELRKLREHASRLPTTPNDDELHAVRIRVKRARYAAELAEVAGSRTAAKLVRTLKRLQDVVGEHQDAVVAEKRLREIARARTAIAAGRLIERERARKRAARVAFPRVFAKLG